MQSLPNDPREVEGLTFLSARALFPLVSWGETGDAQDVWSVDIDPPLGKPPKGSVLRELGRGGQGWGSGHHTRVLRGPHSFPMPGSQPGEWWGGGDSEAWILPWVMRGCSGPGAPDPGPSSHAVSKLFGNRKQDRSLSVTWPPSLSLSLSNLSLRLLPVSLCLSPSLLSL